MGASLQLPGGLLTLNPQPEISRYYNLAGTPYTDTTQVLNQVISPIRYIGQTFLVGTVEYWFSPTTADASLSIKIAGSAVSGTGIINYVTKWGTTSSLVNSLIYDNGTNVLINTITDNTVDKLQINGSLIATSIKKTGGLSNQFLMADGSVTTGTGSPIFGQVNYLTKFSSTYNGIASSLYEFNNKLGFGTYAPSSDISFNSDSNKEIGLTVTNFAVMATNDIALTGQPAPVNGNPRVWIPYSYISAFTVANYYGRDMYYLNNNTTLSIQKNGTGPLTPLVGTPISMIGFAITSTGLCYITTSTTNSGTGDIYTTQLGSGIFTPLGETPRTWSKICASNNGDIYAIVSGTGDIYKRTGGVGPFNPLSEVLRTYSGIGAMPNGDIFVAAGAAGIFKQTGGVGTFNLFTNSSNVCVAGMQIYCSKSGVLYTAGNLKLAYAFYGSNPIETAVSTGALNAAIGEHFTGDILASASPRTYILKNGLGFFSELTLFLSGTTRLAVSPSGDIWQIGSNQITLSKYPPYKNVATETYTLPAICKGLCVAIDGSVYYTTGPTIFKKKPNETVFTDVGASPGTYGALASAPNGDVYVLVGSDVAKQTGGVGNFIPLGLTAKSWGLLTVGQGNGWLYACDTTTYDYWYYTGTGNWVRRNLTGVPQGFSNILVDIYGDVYVAYAGNLWKEVGNSLVLSRVGNNTVYSATSTTGDIYSASYLTDTFYIMPRKNNSGGIVKIKGGLGFGTGSSLVQIITGAKNTDGGPQQVEQIAAQFDENKTLKVFGSGVISGPVLINTTVDNTVDKLQVTGSTLVNGLRYTSAINIGNVDINTITVAGFYFYTDAATNTPVTGSGYLTVEVGESTSFVHQLVTTYGYLNTGNRMFTRVRSFGSWGAWAELSTGGGGGGISGSGTINSLPKWNSTSSLDSSIVYQVGNNIGIGSSAINGTSIDRIVVDLSGFGETMYAMSIGGVLVGYTYHNGTDMYVTNKTPTGFLTFQTNNLQRLTIRGSTGNVLIGTTTDNAVDKLQVAGTISANAATTANQVVIKSQLDAVSANIPLGGQFGGIIDGLVGFTNVTLLNAGVYTYFQIGSLVIVQAAVSFTTPATVTTCSFNIQLPINRAATTLKYIGQGVAVNNTSVNDVPCIVTSSSTTRATLRFDNYQGTVDNYNCTFSFQYQTIN